MGDVTTSVACFFIPPCFWISFQVINHKCLKTPPTDQVDLLKLFKDVPPSVPAPAPAVERSGHEGTLEAPSKVWKMIIFPQDLS